MLSRARLACAHPSDAAATTASDSYYVTNDTLCLLPAYGSPSAVLAGEISLLRLRLEETEIHRASAACQAAFNRDEAARFAVELSEARRQIDDLQRASRCLRPFGE